MAKIPFTLDAWLKDKNQRVETRDGRIVHNIWPVKEPVFVHGKRTDVCALIDGEEDMILFFEGGQYLPINSENPFDLFLVTPEEELTEFEEKVKQLMGTYPVATRENQGSLIYEVRKAADELLALAIDARADELSEGLNQSKIDKDSIPYHLIEFMCNLFDCPNWKEIEETAELYVTRLKAAALKDLPRWKKAYETCYIGDSIVIDEYGYYRSNTVKQGSHYILISDIERLPGFKED